MKKIYAFLVAVFVMMSVSAQVITNKPVALVVTDTLSVTSPVRGMVVFAKNDNRFYFRDYKKWAYFSMDLAGDVSGKITSNTVNKLKGISLVFTSLASGDILQYNGTNWVNWKPNYISLSALSETAPITYNNATGAIGITQASTSTNGYLSSADWTTFNNKVSNVTAGSSKVTIGGTATAPTVDVNPANLGAITLATGTTGTDVAVTGSPASLGGTLTLNIPTASASNRGALSSADWTTFNNKQAPISLTTVGTSGAATFSGNTLNIPNYTYTLPAATTSTLGGVIVGSGLSVTGGKISTTNNGTVTTFSSGNLSPLFTTAVATSTTTPALSFSLTNAAANTIFGNNTAASAAPSYFSATALPIVGDVTGTLGASVVSKINGSPLGTTTGATNGQVLAWSSTNNNWAPAAAAPATTTHTLTLATNTLTSTVNGVSATSNTVSGVSNSSSANTLTTTVNGVTGATVNIINSNAVSNPTTNTIRTTVNGVASATDATIIATNTLTSASSAITSTVNGVAATLTPTTGTIANNLGFDASGNLVKQSLSQSVLRGSSSGTISIAAGQTSTTTITVTGATTGSVVQVSPINDNAYFVFIQYAYVSAANTVTVRLANLGNVSQTVGTLQVAVFP